MRSESLERVTRYWSWDHEKLLKVGSHCGLGLIILLLCSMVIKSIFPAVPYITTRHTLEYVPQEYILVQQVTNKFVESAGIISSAGGIGAPQIEVNLDDFRKKDSLGENFLTVPSNSRVYYANLHYFNVHNGRVLHYSITFPSPKNIYSVESASIEGNELILNWVFTITDAIQLIALILAMGFLVWMVLAILLKVVLKEFIY